MLDSIHIEAYRTLRNTTVTFKDGLNIIIGKNGAGKSNLLKFINDVPRIVVNRGLPSQTSKPVVTNFEYFSSITDTSGQEIKFQIGFSKDKHISNRGIESLTEVKIIREVNNQGEEFIDIDLLSRIERSVLIKQLTLTFSYRKIYIPFDISYDSLYFSAPRNITFYEAGHLDYSDTLLPFLFWFEMELENALYEERFDNEGIKDANDIQKVKNIVEESVVKVLESLDLNSMLKKHTNLKEVRLAKNVNVYFVNGDWLIENILFEFLLEDTWVPWSYLSDGTKRSFYLIALIASSSDGLIMVEEPELGLHPFQLYKIMDFIKEQSETKQIIVSTHSPEVLNILNADELDRILIASIEKGATSFRNLTEQETEKAKLYINEVGDLSNYWLHSDLEKDA